MNLLQEFVNDVPSTTPLTWVNRPKWEALPNGGLRVQVDGRLDGCVGVRQGEKHLACVMLSDFGDYIHPARFRVSRDSA